jgi:F-type H+-transporting ATPase subunit delta
VLRSTCADGSDFAGFGQFLAEARGSFERDIVAASNQAHSGVPGRYAAALFELATEEKSADKVGADLTSIQNMVSSSPDLQRLVRSPVFAAEDQQAALAALAAKAGIAGLAANFVQLLARNRRLSALEGAIAAYQLLAAEAKGETVADVMSAEKLSAQQIKDLKSALKASIGRDVQLNAKVDKSLLGGLIVKVGSKMMDNSLKTKLENLKIAMKGTA